MCYRVRVCAHSSVRWFSPYGTTTIGPMGAQPLVDKTSRFLTCTHTLRLVSSGLPGSIGPADGNTVTCSEGRHCAGTTEHGSGTAKQRSTGFSDRVPDGGCCKDLSAHVVRGESGIHVHLRGGYDRKGVIQRKASSTTFGRSSAGFDDEHPDTPVRGSNAQERS